MSQGAIHMMEFSSTKDWRYLPEIANIVSFACVIGALYSVPFEFLAHQNSLEFFTDVYRARFSIAK